MRLHRLGASHWDVRAALNLREVAGVLVEGAPVPADCADLASAGFINLPRTIEVITHTSSNLSEKPRSFRRSLAKSMEAWNANSLHLSLSQLADVRPEVVERLYFEVLVPGLYARGWSPFGVHNHKAFHALLNESTWVALVTRDDRLVGGGVLTERISKPGVLVVGSLCEGPTLTGQVYVLDPSIDGGQRAFLHFLAVRAAEQGFVNLSLGEDLPWMQEAYARVIIEKLAWAGALFFQDQPWSVWASFERCGEDVLYFRRTELGLELCVPEKFGSYNDRISEGVLRIQRAKNR